jgi:hypothetical protein
VNFQCTARATVIGFSSRIASQTREEHLFLQSANGMLTDAIQLQVIILEFFLV